jgi:arylsulfatase A-like enzyme
VTPNIDRLAREGAFMDNAFCPMPSSAPSRASIFTGRFPHSHRVRVNDLPLPAGETTLPELLESSGYLTAAAPKLDEGFERGFHLRDIYETYAASRGVEGVTDEAYLITGSAVEWLEEASEPWFLWLDYESIHEPWRPPEPFRSMFIEDDAEDIGSPRMYQPDLSEREVAHARALYMAEVAMMDENVGRLLEKLEEEGLRESTLVVLASDHGVFLGEHGFFKKPPFLYDPLIRSTLIFSFPGAIPSGVRVKSQAQIVDVMPTILDLLGMPTKEGFQGRSLVPLFDGGQEMHGAVFMEFCEYRGTAVKAVRTPGWKYIHHRSVGTHPWPGDYSPEEVFRKAGLDRYMLFNLLEDPDEELNRFGDRPDIASELQAMILDWMIDTEV